MSTDNDIEKKAWATPNFFVLDFKETRGGPNEDDHEDDEFYFNEFSPA